MSRWLLACCFRLLRRKVFVVFAMGSFFLYLFFIFTSTENYAYFSHNEPDYGPIKIAYLFLIHSLKTAKGLDRILGRLYDPKHTFIIHVDRGSTEATEVLNAVYTIAEKYDPFHNRSNIVVFSRHNIVWCGVSMIQAELDLISMALKTQREWDFAINLSGNCYPIKSPRQIERRLSRFKGKNFLNPDGTVGFDLPAKDNRFREFHVELEDHVQQVTSPRFQPIRYFPNDSHHDFISTPNFTHYYSALSPTNRYHPIVVAKEYPTVVKHGFQWWVLSRDFCEYLIKDPLPRNYLVWFATTVCPDEMYFQTVAYNTKWRETTFLEPTPDITMRYIQWKPYSWHPDILGRPEYHAMFKSNALFARKFDPDETVIYDEIDFIVDSNDKA
jgi:hypothetical protein